MPLNKKKPNHPFVSEHTDHLNLPLSSRPLGWGSRIHWLHLYRRVRLPLYQHVSWLWHLTSDLVMRNTLSLPLLLGPLWPGLLVLLGFTSLNKIKLFNHYKGLLLILYIPHSFSYAYLSGRNLGSSIGDVVKCSLVFLGVCVNFCSYKWMQRFFFIFNVFIHLDSRVNRTSRDLAILDLRSLRRLNNCN